MPTEELSDDFLENCIGRWGRWQLLMFIAISLSKFPIAFHQLNIVFLMVPVETSCKNNAELCSSECDEFVFNRTVFKETIITEWGLVCNWKYLAALAQTITMIGILTGTISFGIIADKFGRKWPLIWAVIITIITGAASAFSPWYSLFAIFRYICSTTTGGTMNTSFVMLMEIIGIKYRTIASVLYQVPNCMGHALLALIAYLERDWRWFVFYQSVGPIVLVSYWCILPEAPRWSLAMGRKEEVIETLEKAAKCNKRAVENVRGLVEAAYNPPPEGEKKSAGNLILLFKRKMVVRTTCIAYNWFVCGFCFYGVAQYINHLSGDIFLNVAIAGLSQIPGACLVVVFIDKFGRRRTLIATNVVASVTTFTLGFIPDRFQVAQTILVGAAISSLMMSFSIVYVYAGELFPTTLRNSGMGVCSVCARVGAMISPFIPDLSEYICWLPCTILAIIPIIGATLCLFLPETKGIQLPNTIEEAEAIGR